ncbi:MAG: hypothetical protein DYG94_00060 [Leptolyngbya sp. PLA3]|nr:MAG: hypothetical protein EDM82_01815 [Cyanobacteria bacterium CYA]MCE7967130.1 hypothetical protein [Leptolyngbya sp. PL-A3]
MLKMSDVGARVLAGELLEAAVPVFGVRVVRVSASRLILDHPSAACRLVVCDDWSAARRVKVLKRWLRMLHHRLLSEWLRAA